MDYVTYIAGFLDGEGCICASNSYLAVTLTNINREPLELAERLFGGTIYEQAPRDSRHKLLFRWQVNGQEAAGVLRYLLPYLIVKRKQALLGIKLADASNRQDRFNIALKLKQSNS